MGAGGGERAVGNLLLYGLHAVPRARGVRGLHAAPAGVLQAEVHAPVPRLGLFHPLRYHPHPPRAPRGHHVEWTCILGGGLRALSLIHISEPTRPY